MTAKPPRNPPTKKKARSGKSKPDPVPAPGCRRASPPGAGTAAFNPNLAAQNRRILRTHYANRYRTGRGS
ncbi:MAG: hypothetical protein D6826_01695 [Alphaproteobacteria bacterium]|nr:MAG: hypothetical protein D6826_01695 [Alphaproteobacteria bacterium]